MISINSTPPALDERNRIRRVMRLPESASQPMAAVAMALAGGDVLAVRAALAVLSGALNIEQIQADQEHYPAADDVQELLNAAADEI